MQGLFYWALGLFFFLLAILMVPHDLGWALILAVSAIMFATLPAWGNF